jgi:hypothetical protein
MPRKTLLIGLSFWLAGLLLAHGTTIFSGFRRIQLDRADSRLMHYMLEHGYRWITGDPHHRSFWDPPVFYPAKNTAAYSETMIGTAPLYGIWRLVGVPQDLSYTFWLLSVSSLNFLTAFLFLRRTMGRSDAAAGFGAFLFSFASIRLAHLVHPQLMAGFSLVLFVDAAVRLFRESDRRRGARWIAVAAATFVVQAYSGFYIAWFLALSIGLALIWSLALPSLRGPAIAALRAHTLGLAIGVVVAGLCLIPFVSHSLKAAADIGYRGYDEVELFLPRPLSWIFFGGNHWVYGRFSTLGLFNSLPRTFEQPIAPGLVTMVLAALGLWRLRTTPLGKLLGVVSLTLIVCTLAIGSVSLWGLLYLVLPGAQAIRAVARVGVILLLPASAGAASLLDLSGWRKPVLIGVALLSMLEQGRTTTSLDRYEVRKSTAALVSQIDRSAEAFFLSDSGSSPSPALLDRLPLRVHLEAVMAGLESGVPTINGYSGGVPPGWTLEGSALAPADSADVERQLAEWCRRHGIDRRKIQWIAKGR